MRVLILGASGRTGRLVVQSAISQGYTVTALVRKPASLTPASGLAIIKGTPQSQADIEAAFASSPASDPIVAVLVTLAVPRESESFFAKPTAAPFFLREVVRNAIAVMEAHNVKKLVYMSAFGSGSSWSELPWAFKIVFGWTPMKIVPQEHDAVDVELRGTNGLDWTILRPVLLKDGDAKTVREMGETGKGVALMDSITRASVAEEMIKALASSNSARKAVVIAN